MAIPPFLISIGAWLLKLFLGGLFKDHQQKQAMKATIEREAAISAAASADEARVVEREIIEEQRKVEKAFREKEYTDTDPFGFEAFNRGE